MPDDSSGIYSLPAGTIVSTGDTILPSQHNPWANDNANAMSNRFSKDGRAPATGNWNLNNFRITNLGAPVATTDAATKAYADAVTTNVSASTRGYLFGLTLSNNASDAVNDIDIAAGAAASDATVPVTMTLSSILTKRLDAAWAVGTGNGGLDTGAIANATYHVWLIQRSDTGVVDGCLSLSATSPTFGGNIPTAYDRKRLVGSVVRVSGSLRLFTQRGDDVMWSTPILDVSATSAGTAAVTRTLSVPTGRVFQAIMNVKLDSSGGNSVYLSALTEADLAPSGSAAPLGSVGTAANTVVEQSRVWTNTSAQIRSRQLLGGASDTLLIATIGYVDTRGRT